MPDLTKAQIDAGDAQFIVSAPVFKEALKEQRNEYIQLLENSDEVDEKLAVDCMLGLRNLKGIVDKLHDRLSTASIEKKIAVNSKEIV